MAQCVTLAALVDNATEKSRIKRPWLQITPLRVGGS